MINVMSPWKQQLGQANNFSIPITLHGNPVNLLSMCNTSCIEPSRIPN